MSERYAIIRSNDCIVIEGAIPIDDLTSLIKAWEKRRAEDEPAWIVDSLLSGHLKCNMVVGPPEACLAWRERLGLAVDGPRPRYRLVDEPFPGITCTTCGRTSYNANDIQHRYCGNCNKYLDDQ